MIGLGKSPYHQGGTSLYKLLGAWGFSDRAVSFRMSQYGDNVPSGVLKENNIVISGSKASLSSVTENTIIIASSTCTVALAEENFFMRK